MAIIIPAGLYWPYQERKIPIGSTATVIDATGEKVAAIGQLYLQGRASGSKTLDTSGASAIAFDVSARTFSTSGSTIDVGIQTVRSDVGPPVQPSESFSVKKTLVQGTDTINVGVNSFAPSTGTVSLSHGDLIAVVFDFTTRNGSDALTLRTMQSGPANATSSGRPCGVAYTGSWASSGLPGIILTFSDGTKGWIDGLVSPNTLNTATSWSDATNPDERGMLFQLPFATKVNGLWAMLRLTDANSDSTLILYADPLGTPTAIATSTNLAEQYRSTGSADTLFYAIASPVSLSANTDYCVALRATGSSNIRQEVGTLMDAALRECFVGGTTIQGVTRNNGSGAFGSASSTTIYPSGVRICELPEDGGPPIINTRRNTLIGR